MPEHDHTEFCAARSRFTIVRTSVVAYDNGRNDVRIGVKPSALCWADLATVHVGTIWLGDGLPRSQSEALERAAGVLDILRADSPPR